MAADHCAAQKSENVQFTISVYGRACRSRRVLLRIHAGERRPEPAANRCVGDAALIHLPRRPVAPNRSAPNQILNGLATSSLGSARACLPNMFGRVRISHYSNTPLL